MPGRVIEHDLYRPHNLPLYGLDHVFSSLLLEEQMTQFTWTGLYILT